MSLGQESVTIKRIAREAGVTHGTVSRALRGDPRVREQTCARIRGIAERLGYIPSGIGRGLKMRRTFTLGLVMTYFTDPFFAEVIHGLHDEVSPRGYNLVVAASGDSSDEQFKAAARKLAEQRVDGLLLGCLPRLPGSFLHALAQPSVPFVIVNNHYGVPYACAVSHNDARAIEQCVDLLVGQGHRRLGYIGNAWAGCINDVRSGAFRGAVARAGLKVRARDVVLARMGGLESGYEAMRTALARWKRSRPTAVLCYNDLIAVGALRACRDAGIEVPRQISIVGFDDVDLAAYVDPALTTFAQPKYELGREAGRMMLAMLMDGVMPAHPTVLEGSLVCRASTAPP